MLRLIYESFDYDSIITPKMRDCYYKRTNNHINLVKKYCNKIYEYDKNKFEDLINISQDHDKLKLQEPELSPYIIITWDYYCNDNKIPFNIPENIKKQLGKATEHHVINSKHHPEYWQDRKENILDIDSRDGTTIPNVIIDGTKMPDVYIGEMCADWMAMSEERGNSPQEWADKVINKRWKFTDDQIKLIYELLNNIWGK
jgi:hypothetical protein